MTDRTYERIERLRAARPVAARLAGAARRPARPATALAAEALYERDLAAFDDRPLPRKGPGFRGLWTGAARGRGW